MFNWRWSGFMAQIELNEQFKRALDLMENTKKSVFVTGKAGTGKSTLLELFCNQTKKSVIVLAPTGVAAVNIRGETIHSFFKFKPEVTPKEAQKIAREAKRKRKELFRKLEAIVIDEISMVRADLLDCIDLFLKTIYQNKLPFGRLQMIFFGDLYQLPPVLMGKEKEIFRSEYKSAYFFDAKAMRDFQMELIELEKVYRQKDQKFIEILNRIRNNTIGEEELEIINQRVREGIDPSKIEDDYVYLTTINKLAEKINKINLERLPSKKYILEGEIEGEFDQRYLPTELNLEVKKGAQIMLLNNDSKGRWINGTMGKILDLKNDKIKVRLQNGSLVWVSPFRWEILETYFDKEKKNLAKRVLGAFLQYPIKLAWAITVHKSQGKTFDKVIIDLSGGVFSCGQVYVALSRCTSLNGIILKKEIKKRSIFTDWKIVKFLTNYQYNLSERICSKEEKLKIIQEAIRKRKKLKIVYLKSKDEKSERIILPQKIGQMEYCGRKYLGIQAHCFLRNEMRIFRLERILEINPAPFNGILDPAKRWGIKES